MRLWESQRSSWASSHTFAIVISSLAPGAAATKCWNAEEPVMSFSAGPPSWRRSHSCSAAVGSMLIAQRFSASSISCSRRTPSRAKARETRSCSATSHTIVRRPCSAAASPSAADTVVLPTPPLPVT